MDTQATGQAINLIDPGLLPHKLQPGDNSQTLVTGSRGAQCPGVKLPQEIRSSSLIEQGQGPWTANATQRADTHKSISAKQWAKIAGQCLCRKSVYLQ